MRSDRDGSDWRIELDVLVPGYGDHAASMRFVEHWQAMPSFWRRREYAYDYFLEPRGSGRRAHHFHDGIVHAHCEDPFPAHTHYRDVEVELLEAAEDFAASFARGAVTYVGLFPL